MSQKEWEILIWNRVLRSRQSAAFSGLWPGCSTTSLGPRDAHALRGPQAAKFPPGLVGFPGGLAAFPSPLVVWISGCWICAGFHRATGPNFPFDLPHFRRTRSKFFVIVAEIFILLGFILCFPPWSVRFLALLLVVARSIRRSLGVPFAERGGKWMWMV